MTLYLKYRPQTLQELDLTSVREQLSKIVESDNFPHAFLFSGPKGVGKTSSARILAKIINCEGRKKGQLEPCNKCEQCLSITKGANIDVIELDAASNRGIDDIRALRESINLSPIKARKKIYIFDEVHMLTAEAANAFLKTLEEPPKHVVFILATTNPEKLPQTIHSRLTSINFSRATEKEVERQIQRVVKGEKLKIEKGVESLIAKASEGSLRDAHKILESLITNFDHITVENTQEFLFQTAVLQINKLLDLLEKKDVASSLIEIERVVASGGSMKVYIESLLISLHKKLLTDPSPELITLIELITTAKLELSTAFIVQLPLEIAICKWCGPTQPKKIESEKKVPEKLVKKIDEETWKKLLSNVKQKNSSIEALLRSAQPLGFDGKTLVLGVFYQFHKERLEVSQNKRTLEDELEVIYGSPIRINCTLTKKPQSTQASKQALQDAQDQDIISAAKEIFGS